MVKYEMDNNRWTNTSGPDDVGRAEGAMVYIPAGGAGVLVYMGGVKDGGKWSVTRQPMDEVLVHDVLSFKWYKQKANGHVPETRSRFCAGVTWAEDRSSYNIYLYRGASMPPSATGFDDVYILSLLSFTWIKLYPEGHGTGDFPPHSLSCTVTASLSQMLIIAGTFPLSDMCDTPEKWGVHNLDLGRQNPDGAVWMLFDPEKKGYVVPKDISDAIGGGEKRDEGDEDCTGGGLRQFRSGDPALTDGVILPAATDEENIPGEDTGGGLSRGAVLGIAVGSAVGILLVIFGVACVVWRRRRTAAAADGAREAQCSETRDYALPVPLQADPIELAVEPSVSPGASTPTPDPERGKEHWAGSPELAVSGEEGLHELSATPGVGTASKGERVHAIYYHA